MFTTWKSCALAAAIACSLAAAPPAFCADEKVQAQLLNQVFSRPEPEWTTILRDNAELIDQSFFQRVDERLRWNAENNQIDDAIRFALLGDFACNAVGITGGYRLGLATWFERAGNDELARPLIENILMTNPEMHQARYLRAAYLRNDGDFGGAERDYQVMIEAGYRVADCEAALGMLATVMQKWPEAKRHFEKAVALEPQHAIAAPALDRIDAREVPGGAPFQDVPPADRGIARSELLVDPKLFALYLRQAETALKSNKLREAELNYQKAVVANPKDGAPRIYLGALYYRMGHLSDALFFINAGLGLAPENVDGWRFAGCAFERRFDLSGAQSDLANARRAYSRTLELHPGDSVAQMGLERLTRKTQ